MRRRSLLPLACALPARAQADTAQQIERDAGGRLGIMVLDTATGPRLTWRADERFPMNSTFKSLLAAAVLARGAALLERTFTMPTVGFMAHSAVTETRAGGSMTGSDLCEAMLATSDNTATNLLLDALDGPPALTAWLRERGDLLTRLDRREPELNEAQPGDPRDTTTPAAMAATLRRLALDDGPALDRAMLLGWMRAHRNGGALLRAGMPGWTLADRSGAGGFGSRGAIAVAVPPQGGSPWVIAVYLHQGPAALAARDAVIARVGGLVAALAR